MTAARIRVTSAESLLEGCLPTASDVIKRARSLRNLHAGLIFGT
jgi:hypothetical protein